MSTTRRFQLPYHPDYVRAMTTHQPATAATLYLGPNNTRSHHLPRRPASRSEAYVACIHIIRYYHLHV